MQRGMALLWLLGDMQSKIFIINLQTTIGCNHLDNKMMK